MLRLFVSPRLEERAREHAQQAAAGHLHRAAGTAGMSWRERLTAVDAWTDVAHNFSGDWGMLWKEITIGFLLAGFIGLLGDDFFNALFVTDAPPASDDRERDRRARSSPSSASSARSATCRSPPCCGRAGCPSQA